MSEARMKQIKDASELAYQLPEERKPLQHGLEKKNRIMHGLKFSVSGYREAFRRGAKWADENPIKDDE